MMTNQCASQRFRYSLIFRRMFGALLFLLSCALLLLSTSCVSPPLRSGAGGESAPIHLRLIWTESPQHRAVVCWDTTTEGRNHRVYYDTISRNGILKEYANSQVCTTNGPYPMEHRSQKGVDGAPAEPDLYYHHAPVTGLKPGTTYYFVIASGDAISEEFHFKTAPAGDEPLKIIYGGDSRTGHDARRQINGLIGKMAEDDASILAFAHGGDYVSDGTNLKWWKLWLADHELTITPSRRMLPLIPARGNHEKRGPIYDQVFAFPGGEGKNYFPTQLSPEILFLTLNTEIDVDGPQKAFLKTSLAEAESIQWRVAQYHRPLYPAVKNPGAGVEHWVPLFETYNLALACEADGHCIKRTLPIRNGKHDPTGVIYIGEGGLGVGQRTPRSDRWYIQAPGMIDKGHHFQLISFTKSLLKIEVVGIDGTIIDTHLMNARD